MPTRTCHDKRCLKIAKDSPRKNVAQGKNRKKGGERWRKKSRFALSKKQARRMTSHRRRTTVGKSHPRCTRWSAKSLRGRLQKSKLGGKRFAQHETEASPKELLAAPSTAN